MILSECKDQNVPFYVTLSFSEEGRAYYASNYKGKNHYRFATETYIKNVAELLGYLSVPTVVICDDGYSNISYFSRTLNLFSPSNLMYFGNFNSRLFCGSRSISYARSIFNHFSFTFFTPLASKYNVNDYSSVITYLNDNSDISKVSFYVFDGTPLDNFIAFRRKGYFRLIIMDFVILPHDPFVLFGDPSLFTAEEMEDTMNSFVYKNYSDESLSKLWKSKSSIRYFPDTYKKYFLRINSGIDDPYYKSEFLTGGKGSVHIDLYNRTMRRGYFGFDQESLPLPMTFGKGINPDIFLENYSKLSS